MTSRPHPFRLLPPIGALLALWPLAAVAEENAEWRELVLPTQTIELGLGQTSGVTYKFGEYNGLAKNGTHAIGHFTFQGGGRYDNDGAVRWRIEGTDLGLPTHRLTSEYGEQGSWHIRYLNDQLPHFASDGYQTPLLGAGSSNLTLPATLSARTATGPNTLPALNGEMRPFSLDTQRTRHALDFSVHLAGHWLFKAGYRHELKEGAKATGAVSGGSTGTVMLLPEPLNMTTDQWEGSLGWEDKTGHFRLSYLGSLFHNDIKALNFQNPFSTGHLDNRLGTAPDNQAHLLRLEGSWRLSATNRLVGGLSFGRQTQNQAFLPYSTDPAALALPRTSLNGLVVTRSAHLRLTARPLKNLNLTTGYRFDERDNRTDLASFTRTNYEAGSAGIRLNAPHNRQIGRLTAQADWTTRPGGAVTFGLEREDIHRNCRDGVASCIEVAHTTENTYRAEVHQSFEDGMTARIAYTQALRRGSNYAALSASAAPVELAGMRKFFLADRDRIKLRASFDMPITQRLTVGATLDVSHDRFDHSQYGLKRSRNHTLNLDTRYVINEDFSAHAFASMEKFLSRIESNYGTTEDTDHHWMADLHDRVATFGAGIKRNLLSGRLELSADLALVDALTRYQLSGGICSTQRTAPCGPMTPSPLPDVPARSLELRLNGKYALDTATSLRMAYLYARRRVEDYAYDAMTATSSTKVLGTTETAPHYDGHLLSLSYLVTFR